MKKQFILSKLVFFLHAALCISGAFGQQVKLKKNTIEQFKMLLPTTFTPLDLSELNQRFAFTNRPKFSLADPKREAEFYFNQVASTWASEDIELLSKIQKAAILELYKDIKFIKSEVRQINGINCIEFVYTGTMKEGKMLDDDPLEDDQTMATMMNKKEVGKFQHIVYIIEKDSIFSFNFSCEKKAVKDWQPVAQQMMESIQRVKN